MERNALAGAWLPETEAERNAIREQLDRVLSSPLFKHSKRYPNLLRFSVDRALDGRMEPLKERTLGAEVFGREPDYDTNLDPVVRTTAVEIRKRIAQYYNEPGHEMEIRIDFPPGTYMPEFRMPPKPAVTVEPRPRNLQYGAVAAALSLVVAAVIAVRIWTSPAPIDLFWAPVLSSSGTATVYIGQNTPEESVVSLTDLHNSERVAFADSTAMARVTAYLVTHHKLYRLRLQPKAKMEDLRDGPTILIGAFNNDWTLRLTNQLRFNFSRDTGSHLSWIADREHPEMRKWSHVMNASYLEVKEDYAIVSRVVDPATGKIVVTASGLAQFGTEAAGEFLTCEQCMKDLAAGAPRDWDRKNMQIVITADVVGRSAGPPRILSTLFW